MQGNPYCLPVDERERIRLDELQFVVRSIYDANIMAPISQIPTHILDVGTGSGRPFHFIL